MAGLASITMPIETAAQSSVLQSQIRPPDKKSTAARLYTGHNGEERIGYETLKPSQCAPVKYFNVFKKSTAVIYSLNVTGTQHIVIDYITKVIRAQLFKGASFFD